MSEEFDASKIRALFAAITGGSNEKEEKRTRTVDHINKAEDAYARVSGMKNMKRGEGKGYSVGGVAERVALYAGIDEEVLDQKLNHLAHHMYHEIEQLIEQLAKSEDPDDASVLVDLQENTTVHMVRNLAHHSFWLGFFMREIMKEDGSFEGFDMESFKTSVDEDVLMGIFNDAAVRSIMGVSKVMIEARSRENREEGWDIPIDPLGISLSQLVSLQEPVARAAEKTASNHPDLLDTEPGDRTVNLHGMTLAMGLAIGRILQERGM